jgi:hypothetical protein
VWASYLSLQFPLHQRPRHGRQLLPLTGQILTMKYFNKINPSLYIVNSVVPSFCAVAVPTKLFIDEGQFRFKSFKVKSFQFRRRYHLKQKRKIGSWCGKPRKIVGYIFTPISVPPLTLQKVGFMRNLAEDSKVFIFIFNVLLEFFFSPCLAEEAKSRELRAFSLCPH